MGAGEINSNNSDTSNNNNIKGGTISSLRWVFHNMRIKDTTKITNNQSIKIRITKQMITTKDKALEAKSHTGRLLCHSSSNRNNVWNLF